MMSVLSKSDERHLEILMDILTGIPDVDSGSEASMAAWLAGCLEWAAETFALEGALLLTSSAVDIKTLASHGLDEVAVNRIMDDIDNSKYGKSGAPEPTDPESSAHTSHALTVDRNDRVYTITRSELPDEQSLWLVFVTTREVDRDLSEILRVLAAHLSRIIAGTLLATKVRIVSKNLESVNQQLKEMQVSSLNIMEDLQRKNRDLQMLNTLAQEIASRPTLRDLAKGAAEAASKMLDGASIAIYVIDSVDSVMRPEYISTHATLDSVEEFAIHPADPLSEQIRQGKVTQFDSTDDEVQLKLANALGCKTGIIMPLCSKNEILGFLLGSESRWHRIFTDDESENLRVLATTLAVAIENARLMAQMAEQVEEMSILKEYIETVVDSVDLAVLVIDADLKITVFSKGFERMYGYKREDFVGKHIFEAFPHLLEQGFAEVAQQVISGIPFQRYGWRRRLLDGREVVQNMQVFPHRDASGKIIGGIAISEDITEKANLEDRLARSEAKFSRVVEDLDDGYLIITEGKVVYANKAACELTGIAAFKLLGQVASDIISDDRLVSECNRPTGARLKLESRITHTSGTWIPVEVSVGSCEYGGKHAVSMIMRDITDRKRIEKQLEEKNREMHQRNEQITRLNLELEATVNKLKASQENLIKSERVAAITETAVAANHEINNPLFSILGQAQLLLRKYKNQDEDTKRRLEMIEESALRISCVTKKLANLADPVVKEYPGISAHMIDLDRSTVK